MILWMLYTRELCRTQDSTQRSCMKLPNDLDSLRQTSSEAFLFLNALQRARPKEQILETTPQATVCSHRAEKTA